MSPSGRPIIASSGVIVAQACILASLGLLAALGINSALPGGQLANYISIALAIAPALGLLPMEWLFAGILIAVYVLDGLVSWGLLPRQAPWVIEILVLVLTARVLGEYAAGKRLAKPPLTLLVVGLALFASLVLGLAGGQDPAVAVLGIRKYAVYPLIGVLLIVGNWRTGFDSLLWRTIVAIAFVQVPITFLEAVILGGGDVAGGTLGPNGTGLVAVIVTAVALAIFGAGLGGDDKTRWYGRGLAVLLLLVPPAFGSALAAAPIMIAGLIFMLAANPRSWKRAFPAALAIVAVVWLALPFLSTYLIGIGYPDPVRLLSNPMLALNYGPLDLSSTGVGRVEALAVGWDSASSHGAVSIALGQGLFSASPSYFGDQLSGSLIDSSPYVRYVTSSVGRGLIETGIVGVASMVLVCGDCMRRGWLLRRTAGRNLSGISCLAMTVGLVLMTTSFYHDSWNEPSTALLLWMSYALVVRAAQKMPTSVSHTQCTA